jgi:hypothetical protein
MARLELQAVLDAGLASVPHVSGINNHMGSALTQGRSTLSTASPVREALRCVRPTRRDYVPSAVTSFSTLLRTPK